MKTMKDYCPKISDAVRAMIEGLKEQSERPDFRIDMSDFGYANRKICFGCAATCAVQRATRKKFTAKNISIREVAGVDRFDISCFEEDIDSLRRGYPAELFEYYGYGDSDSYNDLMYTQDFRLTTENWRSELPKVERYLEKLIKAGL